MLTRNAKIPPFLRPPMYKTMVFYMGNIYGYLYIDNYARSFPMVLIVLNFVFKLILVDVEKIVHGN